MKVYKVLYIVLAAVFLLLTNIVYINFASRELPGLAYTGAIPYAAADKLVYFSMIEQGRESLLFMRNLHTIDPQQGLLLSPHWYLIGQTAQLLDISTNASYQAYRIIFTLAFLALLFFLLQKLFTNRKKLVLASTFVFFSGGLGWIVLLLMPGLLASENGQLKFLYSPVDLYVTEGNTLLNFMQAPLFSLSQFLILLILFLFVWNSSKKSYWLDCGGALLALILILIHPYDAPIIYAVLGSYTVWQLWKERVWRGVVSFGIVASGGLLSTLYHAYVLVAEPSIREWYAQNLVYSPPAQMYLIGYGLLLPLAALGVMQVLKKDRDNEWWVMIGIWCCIIPVLLYAPITVNRRFINGWHIALAIMAVRGFLFFLKRLKYLWLKIIAASLIALLLISHLSFILLVSLYFSESSYTHGYYYRSDEEYAMAEALRSASLKHDNILASDMKTGFVITSLINRTVFRVHDHQTPASHLKQQEMDWFFSEPVNAVAVQNRQEFLQKNAIQFVIVNELWLKHPVLWPRNAPFLEQIFQGDNYTVYKVRIPS